MTPKPPTDDPARAGARQHAPAVARNTAPILNILKTHLPTTGRVLEVGSGTGEHAVAFARALPAMTWQPSDPEPSARESISAWSDEAGLDNILAPLAIDLEAPDWERDAGGLYDAILSINLIHIAPWEAALGLLRGAGALLVPGGLLYFYGPFRRGGEQTAQSNVRFEAWLKAQSPGYGVRDMGEIENEARAHGLTLNDAIDMPANNFSLILRKC